MHNIAKQDRISRLKFIQIRLLELLIFYMSRLLIALFLCIYLPVSAIEKAEGVVYCSPNKKTLVEYRLANPDKSGNASDVDITVNGITKRYMTAYSWFGSNQPTPKDFKFAILGEKQFDGLLVFNNHLEDAQKVKYTQCN